MTRDSRPRLLDLFCGAGGATKGYQRAGFYVVGVDSEPQPRYCGDEFIRADALKVLQALLTNDAAAGYLLADFTGIHASPPCQAWSDLQRRTKRDYPRLIAPVRALLEATHVPYVIENVEGAPLHNPLTLCGTMFSGLRVLRHRLFETSFLVPQPPHSAHPLVFTHDKRKAHYGKLDQNTSFVQVTGGGNARVANKRAAMGINWMIGKELNEAIPPAYAEYVGTHLMIQIVGVAR